jgi:hypothetical protein
MVAKEPAHTSCRELLDYAWTIICNAGGGNWDEETSDWQIAASKFREGYYSNLSKRNNPKQPAPKVTDDLWIDVYNFCRTLGMESASGTTPKQDVIAFIRALAQRAGEGYTVHEIYEWLNYLNGEYDHIAQAMQLRNDPQDGIKAVTKRKKGRVRW